jgi:serine phosphatase RsbU (regulator of sigma subunit)
MKKIGPVLGVAGAALMATGFLFKTAHFPWSGILYNLGVLVFNIGFLPYLLMRNWKELNALQKTERILGILGAMLLLNGILFKNQHWVTAGIQMTLAVFLFIFGFLPLQFHIQWRKGGTSLQKAYAIVRFAAIFIILLGFIFKMMHWPGSVIGLLAGTLMLPVFLIFYFILRWKSQGKIPFSIEDLLITIIAYTIWSFVSTNQITPDVIWGYMELEARYEQTNAGLESSNAMIYESIDSIGATGDEALLRSIAELRALSTDYHHTCDSVKTGFYRFILMERYNEDAKLQALDRDQLTNTNLGSRYFEVDARGILLKEMQDQFLSQLRRIAEANNIQTSQIGLGLDTRVVFYRRREELNWQSYMFTGNPVGAILVNLSWNKQMALLSESVLLNALISQMDLSGEARLLQEMAARESEKAIQLKENEITRVKQEQELQEARLEQSLMETKQNRMMAIGAFGGVALVLVLFSISTRAYYRKQKDNKKLAEQKHQIEEKNEELNQQNEEIAAQRDEIEAQRDLVFQQKEQIEKTHEEISSSIDYAKRLQASILPNTGLLEKHFSDYMVFFMPKQKVSGDFYWWTEVEGRIVVTAADCTGHGVPGAFMSMLGISLLREIVNREYITHPGVILNRLRKEVIRSLDQRGDQGEQKDGMDMALLSIDPETLMCEYAGANNPFYLVREGRLTEYRPDRMPVSHYPRLDKFTNQEILLQKGDQLYLFSDGYADQFGGERRKKFKYKSFQQLLMEHTGADMRKQHDILLEAIVKWQGNNEQIDDMVIVGIKM